MQNSQLLFFSGEKKNLVLFITLFFLIHVTFVVLCFTFPEIRENNLIQLLVRFIFWTLPPVILLLLAGKNIIEYFQLRQNVIKGILYGAGTGAAIFVINAAGFFFQNHHLDINLDLGWGLWLRAVVLVGFSEEILFRGYILPKINEFTNFRTANIIQASLFLFIHFPGWFFMGLFGSPEIIRHIGFILFIGLLNGFLFKKSGSIWSCILVHSISNMASLTMPV